MAYAGNPPLASLLSRNGNLARWQTRLRAPPAPCRPSPRGRVHDGFRIIARKNGPQVRLYSRPGNDLTRRFPLIAETLARLRSRSCIIDGEAVACDDNGVASFDPVGRHRHNDRALLYAFDLIELNGDDMRRDRWKCARPRFEVCWLRLALACASTSIWKATARPSSPTQAMCSSSPALIGWPDPRATCSTRSASAVPASAHSRTRGRTPPRRTAS